MKVEIKDLLGIDHIEFDINAGVPHAIIGKNASGKTSVASIIGALACHNSNPFGVSAAQTKAYTRRGAREGFAILTNGDNEISWRVGTQIENTLAPLSNPAAVGMVDLVNAKTPAKQRVAIWESIILAGATIGTEILEPHFKGRPKREYEAVCKTIEDNGEAGWMIAHDIFVKLRASGKSDWETIVGNGTRYSKNVAPKWAPVGWLPEYEKYDQQELEDQLAHCRQLLDNMSVQEAVNESQIEEGIAAKETIEERKEEIRRIKGFLKTLREEYTRLKEQRTALVKEMSVLNDKMRKLEDSKADANAEQGGDQFSKEIGEAISSQSSIEQEKGHLAKMLNGKGGNCPECSAEIAFVNGDFIAWGDDAKKQVQQKMAEADERIDQLEKKISSLKGQRDAEIGNHNSFIDDKIAKLQSEFDAGESQAKKIIAKQDEKTTAGEEAKAKIAKIEGAISVLEKTAKYADADVGDENHDQVIAARKAVEEAETLLANYKQWHEAQKAHEAVCANDYIVKVLAPGGAKDAYLSERVRVIEKALKRVVELTGWSNIAIDSQYGITINETPAAFASKSERWRAQCALQIVVGMFHKSEVTVLDEVDILDHEGFEGLMKLLDKLSSKFTNRFFVFAGTELSGLNERFTKTEL